MATAGSATNKYIQQLETKLESTTSDMFNMKARLDNALSSFSVYKNEHEGGKSDLDVKKFDGSREGPIFTDFWEQFEILATSCGYSDNEKVRKFPRYLAGLAFSVYRNLNDATKNDYAALIRKLKDEFEPKESLASIRAAGDQDPDKINAEEFKFLADRFILGLTEKIRNPLLGKEYNNWDDAVKLAQKAESNQTLQRMLDEENRATTNAIAGFQDLQSLPQEDEIGAVFGSQIPVNRTQFSAPRNNRFNSPNFNSPGTFQQPYQFERPIDERREFGPRNWQGNSARQSNFGRFVGHQQGGYSSQGNFSGGTRYGPPPSRSRGRNATNQMLPRWNAEGQPRCFQCNEYGHMASQCSNSHQARVGAIDSTAVLNQGGNHSSIIDENSHLRNEISVLTKQVARMNEVIDSTSSPVLDEDLPVDLLEKSICCATVDLEVDSTLAKVDQFAAALEAKTVNDTAYHPTVQRFTNMSDPELPIDSLPLCNNDPMDDSNMDTMTDSPTTEDDSEGPTANLETTEDQDTVFVSQSISQPSIPTGNRSAQLLLQNEPPQPRNRLFRDLTTVIDGSPSLKRELLQIPAPTGCPYFEEKTMRGTNANFNFHVVTFHGLASEPMVTGAKTPGDAQLVMAILLLKRLIRQVSPLVVTELLRKLGIMSEEEVGKMMPKGLPKTLQKKLLQIRIDAVDQRIKRFQRASLSLPDNERVAKLPEVIVNRLKLYSELIAIEFNSPKHKDVVRLTDVSVEWDVDKHRQFAVFRTNLLRAGEMILIDESTKAYVVKIGTTINDDHTEDYSWAKCELVPPTLSELGYDVDDIQEQMRDGDRDGELPEGYEYLPHSKFLPLFSQDRTNVRGYDLDIAYSKQSKILEAFQARDPLVFPAFMGALVDEIDVSSNELTYPLKRNLNFLHHQRFREKQYNESQTDAIVGAIQTHASVIRGSAGTGKTMTAAGLVFALCLGNPSVDFKILVTAQSNCAVDNVAQKIYEMFGDMFNLVRVFPDALDQFVEPELRAYSLIERAVALGTEDFKETHQCYCDNQLTLNEIKVYFRERKELQRQALAQAKIIVTTNNSSMKQIIRGRQFKFDAVITDEGSQCSVPEALLPIETANAPQITIIGDNNQLSPLILDDSEALEPLRRSLLELFVIRKLPVFKLMEQYRMQTDIASFSTMEIYREPILNAAPRSFNFIQIPGGVDGSVMIHDIPSMESSGLVNKTSFCNEMEVQAAVQVVDYLVRYYKFYDEKITVMAPYSAQVAELRQALARSYPRVHVSTIDAMQGKENDVVVISMVRTTPNCGFLANKRRLNVMMTRARIAEVLIGNFRRLTLPGPNNQLIRKIFTHYGKAVCGMPLDFEVSEPIFKQSFPVKRIHPVKQDKESSVITKAFKYSISNVLYLLYTVLVFMANPTFCMEFNICGGSKSGFAISIPKVVHCNSPKVEKVISTKVGLWVPRENPVKITGYKCSLHTYTVSTHVGFFGGKGIVEDKSSVKSFGVHECWDAVKTEMFQGKNLTRSTEGLMTTANSLKVSYEWCCYDYKQEVTNLVVATGVIATMSGSTAVSDLSDFGGCELQKGFCSKQDGVVVWDTKQVKSICPFEFKNWFDAELSLQHVVISELQAAFTLAPRAVVPTCTPKGSMKTAQGVVLQLSANQAVSWSQSASNSGKRPLNTTAYEVEHPDPLDAKLEFLVTRIENLENKKFQEVWSAMCRLANRDLSLIWQIARIDPSMAARTLLNRSDIYATFAGIDILMVWSCSKVSASHIYWSYMVDGRCHEYLPVTIRNSTWFVVPGTTDLIQDSLEVSCAHHHHSIFRTEQGFNTTGGKIHVTELPAEISWRSSWTAFTFKAPALFHSDLSGIQTTIGLLRSYVTKTAATDRKLNALVRYTAELHYNPDVIISSIKAAGESIGTALEKGGDAVGRIIEGGGHAVGEVVTSTADGADTLIQGSIQWLINLAVCGIVILVLGVVGKYLFNKYWDRCFGGSNIDDSDDPPAPEAYVQHAITSSSPSLPITWPTISGLTQPARVTTPIITDVSDKTMHVNVVNAIGSVSTLISIEIDGIRCAALFDTGSKLSLLAENFAVKYGVLVGQRQTNAISVTGHSLDIVGSSGVVITIGARFVQQIVHIVRNSNYNCILGTDFMGKLNDITINIRNSFIVLDKVTIPIEQFSTRNFVVSVISDTTLNPRSEIVLQCATQRGFSDAFGVFMFEPKQGIAETNIMLANSLHEAGPDRVPIRFLNSTRMPIKLYKNQSLGFLEKVDLVSTIADIDTTPDPEKVKYIRDKDNLGDISEAQSKCVMGVLEEFSDIFASSTKDLGQTFLVQHHIVTENENPINQRPYRLHPKQREILGREVERLQAAGHIRPSCSPYSAPVVMVPKKDGTTRVCIDYRKLNSQTVKDVHPLPRIDELLDSLFEMQWFSSLDMMSGFNQVGLYPPHQYKSAFSVPNLGLFEWNVMPFGMCNAPATFTRLMNIVLSGLRYKNCLVYLDDVIVMSKDFETHIIDLKVILQRFRQYNLKLKITKCDFCKSSLNFLGFVVTKDGIKTDPEKLEKVANMKMPKNVDEVRSYLGYCSFYRRFIRSFSTIAAPLHELLKKSQQFVWRNEQTMAFKELQSSLINALLLVYPNFDEEFIICCDASSYGIGGVLAQVRKGEERPVSFISRSLSNPEKNYSVTDKEGLAMYYCIKTFQPYIHGTKFTVYTDHKPLLAFMRTKHLEGRLLRWSLYLQNHTFEIKYREGKHNKVADCMSRLVMHGNKPIVAAVSDTSSSSEWETENVPTKQQNDPYFGPIYNFLAENTLPSKKKLSDQIQALSEKYVFDENRLFLVEKKKRSGTNQDPEYRLRLAVPRVLVSDVLFHCHDSRFAGHLGFYKTHDKVKIRFYWPSLRSDTYNYVKSCVKCQMRKFPAKHPKEQMVSIRVSYPFERVGVDVAGKFPLTYDGSLYVVVFIDHFTKFVRAFAIPDQKAETIADIFVDRIVCEYGAPQILQSDRGSNFVSKILKSACNALGTNKIETTAYHAQANGQTERWNATMDVMLSMYVATNQRDWDRFLPTVTFAYNSSVHSSTRESPFFLVYGRDPPLPTCLGLFTPPSSYVETADYKTVLITRLNQAWKIARENIKAAQAVQKRNFDQNAVETHFTVGDLVCLRDAATQKGKCPKLSFQYKGPYRVLEVKVPDLIIKSMKNPRQDEMTVHCNNVKLFTDRETVPLPDLSISDASSGDSEPEMPEQAPRHPTPESSDTDDPKSEEF